MSLPRRARRLRRALVFLVGALGLNCRDGAGPDLSAGRLAIVPMFESVSAGQIDFDRMRITLEHPEGGTALDTVIATPPEMDPIDVSLSVPLTAARQELLLYLRLVNSVGDTVLRNDPYPQSVTVSAGGSAAPVPVTIRATIGSIVVTPVAVVFSSLGEIRQFAAIALDDNAVPVTTQPISFAWSSSAPAVAAVDPVTGLVTAVSNGTATIRAAAGGVFGEVLVMVSQLATQLVFTTQPSNVATALVIAPAVTVAIQDARGNPVAGFSDIVRIAIATNPVPGSLLSGTMDKPAVNGVAQFTDLSIDQPGLDYTLSVSVSGLAPIISIPFAVFPAPLTVYWVNGAGGLWSTASNWSTGAVPRSADNVVITMAGTYTVTLDVDATFAGLTVGGSSGEQTLIVAGRTVTAANTQVTANGVLRLLASTMNGALASGGMVLVEGTTFVNGSVTIATGSMLQVAGNDTGPANLTVTSGVLNFGEIVLTDVTPTHGATLAIPVGAQLTNALGARIHVATGAGGPRTFALELDNQGDVQMHRALTIDRPGATHFNSGTINATGWDLTIIQSGAGASFTNRGSIALDTSDTLKVSGGAFTHSGPGTISGTGVFLNEVGTTLDVNGASIDARVDNLGTLMVSGSSDFKGGLTNATTGSITLGTGATLTVSNGVFTHDGALGGAGSLVLSGITSADFNTAHGLGAITLSSTAASFATDQSTANTAFLLTNNSAMNGPGTLTNKLGRTLSLRASTIGVPLFNEGDLIVNGASSLTGPVTTIAGSVLRIEGNGIFGAATLSVTGVDGLVNSGVIELTDVTSSYGATLKVPGPALANLGTIDVQTGARGPRTLDAVVNNQGIITVAQSLTVNQQDNATFTNLTGGLVDIAKDQTLRIPLGSVTNSLAARIIGSGILDVRSPARFTNDGEIAPGKSPEILTIAGDPTLTITSLVSVEIGGPALGAEYDQVAVSGNAILDGDLNVVLVGGFVPKAGDEFRVVTYGSYTGSFRTNLPTLPNGLVWQVDDQSDPKALILRVIPG